MINPFISSQCFLTTKLRTCLQPSKLRNRSIIASSKFLRFLCIHRLDSLLIGIFRVCVFELLVVFIELCFERIGVDFNFKNWFSWCFRHLRSDIQDYCPERQVILHRIVLHCCFLLRSLELVLLFFLDYLQIRRSSPQQ